MLKIIRAGIHATIQDGGRFGLRQYGVSQCGALDGPSLHIANLLVGNDPDAAALEITLGQCVVEFTEDTWFALTGAGCDATLNERAVWTGWRLLAARRAPEPQTAAPRHAQLSGAGGRFRRAGSHGLAQYRCESGPRWF